MSLPSDIDHDKLAEVGLAILGLTAFDDHYQIRAGKGFDWDLLDALYEKGWIANPKATAKSVVVTEDGARLAEDFLQKRFGK
jgi:hypothetical protein